MNIGIDARLYGAEKNRGIGRYVEKLLEQLTRLDSENEYTVFLSKDNFDLFKTNNPRFKKVLLDVPWYSFCEQVILPFVFMNYHFDLVHFPHFNVPILYSGKYTVTIHDLIMTHYASDRSTTRCRMVYRCKMRVAKWLVTVVARRAWKIIVPTLYTKQDIIEKLRIVPEHIRVIPEGVTALSVAAKPRDTSLVSPPYFLYVGSAYAHKNLEFLIRAFRRFNTKQTYQLVLVGPQDYFYKRLFRMYIQAKSDVVFRNATDEELAQLYRQATAFVFPSKIEGFGLPPLEAMQYGCPVLVSKASCLPEILGGAAHYFDPTSEDELISALRTIIEDNTYRQYLSQAGVQKAKEYSWERMAEMTLDVYRES